jgi:hypothetical protein
MGVRFIVDDEKLELKLENEYTHIDVIDALSKALDMTTQPLPVLVDVTKSYELKDTHELSVFARFLAGRREEIVPRLAVVVSQEIRYGIARQLGAYLEMGGIKARPFYERDQAMDWLLASPQPS